MTARPPLRDSDGRPIYAYKKGASVKKPRDDPEHRFHKQCKEYLTFALPPEVEWTYTLNGVHLGHMQRTKAAAAGLRRGLGDYVFAIPPGRRFLVYTVTMFEAKAGKGRQSAEQNRWAAKLGDTWRGGDTLEDLRDALVFWGVTPRVPISKASRYAT